jgi:acetyl esterase/lipase
VGAGLRALAAWIAHKFGVRQSSAPFVVMEGLEYARPDGVALHLDILQPNRPGPHPVMLYLHACCTPRPEKFAKPLFNRGLRPGAALLYYGFLQSSCSERALPNSLGNPLCVVERMTCEAALPPIFIASGLNDSLLADSQRMERALRSRSSPCTACYYPGKGYAFHVAHWRTQAPRCWRDSFRFLQQNLPIDAVLEA